MADSAPAALKDFVFDLHQASRISLRGDEVAQTYENYKEITEKIFTQTPLPDQVAIAAECNRDEFFLIFYKYVSMYCFGRFLLFICLYFREMAVRHKIRDLKPQLQDMLDAWNIYQQV